MSDTGEQATGHSAGEKPGVCPGCGYRIRPDDESFSSIGTWDFAHQDCINAGLVGVR